MAHISPHCLKEVQEALERYEEEVEHTNLMRNTQDTYLLHARNFVRWLNDDFTPGARKK